MQPRPLLTKTLSTIRSRYFSQWSTSSSPSRILLKPGPCACTRGLPRYRSTVAVPPKIRLRAAAVEDRRADVAAAGIDRDGLARDAGLEERLGHAVRRPRLLRARLEHQADLHRDDRQPQRVHAGRVRRQHQAEHRGLRLVADRHAALFAVAARQDVRSSPRVSDVEDLPHVGEHEMFFFMFARHMCSGRPVVADCVRANWSGVCVPSPSGSSAFA